MLVLAREKGQSIILYDNVGILAEVTVTDIEKEAVKLGIDAPKNIHIDRREIYERKKRNKRSH